MTDKELVLSRYPEAKVVQKHGYGPHDFDGFIIFDQDFVDANCIGLGETEEAAWENAAALNL